MVLFLYVHGVLRVVWNRCGRETLHGRLELCDVVSWGVLGVNSRADKLARKAYVVSGHTQALQL